MKMIKIKRINLKKNTEKNFYYTNLKKKQMKKKLKQKYQKKISKKKRKII